MKKFSIIIPAYNAEPTITKCVGSIIHQQGSEAEVIVINDNSQDATALRIHTLQDRYPDILIKHHYNDRNLGPSGSRNEGIRQAEGQYLMFMDADDYLSSTHALADIERALAENSEPDILFFGYYVNFRKDMDSSMFKLPIIPGKKDEDKAHILSSKIARTPWQACIRREMLEKAQIAFPEEFSCYEDYIFLTQALAYSNSIGILQKVCYTYNRVMNKATLSSNASKTLQSKLLKLREYINKIDQMIEQGSFPEEQISNVKKFRRTLLPNAAYIVTDHILSKVNRALEPSLNNDRERNYE